MNLAYLSIAFSTGVIVLILSGSHRAWHWSPSTLWHQAWFWLRRRLATWVTTFAAFAGVVVFVCEVLA